jgi:hypothetical protein
MKLSEVKVLDDGKVYLQGGYFLVPAPELSDAKRQAWSLRSIDDHETALAEVALQQSFNSPGSAPGDVYFMFLPFGGWTKKKLQMQLYRPLSKSQAITALFGWVEEQIDYVTEDLHADLMKARKKRSDDAKTVWLHRLNKDGTESRITLAKQYFNSPEEAVAAHNHMVDANPGRTIEHNMHSSNDLGAFKLKLSGKVKT